MTSANWTFAFTVDDVALAGYSTPGHLLRLYDFLDEERLPATFFVVPEGEDGAPAARRPDWAAALAEGLRRGHEFAQHGVAHDRFEVGVPPPMILELPHEGPARKFLAENRGRVERDLTVERIRVRLRRGRATLEDVLGRPISGFRAPALQTCANLWPALAAEGYAYDSSTWFQTAGWDFLNGRMDAPPAAITRAGFVERQKAPGVREFPLTTDYAWFLPAERYAAAFGLARHDAESCFREDVPFVPVCHVSPVMEGEGLRLWRELLAWMRSAAGDAGAALAPTTLGALAAAG